MKSPRFDSTSTGVMGSGFLQGKPAALPVGRSFACLPWSGSSSLLPNPGLISAVAAFLSSGSEMGELKRTGGVKILLRHMEITRRGQPSMLLILWFLSRGSGAGSRRLSDYNLSPGVFVH